MTESEHINLQNGLRKYAYFAFCYLMIMNRIIHKVAVQNGRSTDAFLVNVPAQASIENFYGSPVHIRGDLHSSGSSIMMSVSQNESNFDEATVLVCEVSGVDAVHSRRLNAVYKCFINNNPVDELGDEIRGTYRYPGHPNDGNEGNEGNEGQNGINDVKKCRWVEDEETAETASSDASSDAQCGNILSNADVPGANLPGSGAKTDNMQACIDLCKYTNTCNAVVRVPNGKCYMKSVGQNVQVKVKNQFESHISCGESPASPAAPETAQSAACDTVLVNTNVPGKNLPGSGAKMSTMQGCIDLCTNTATCTAVTRIPNGKCYMKAVDKDVAVEAKVGLTSHIACAGATTPASPPPETEGTQCGKFMANWDLPGANLSGSGKKVSSNEECVNLCSTTAHCNSVVRTSGGKCYMKNVDENVALVAKSGLTSYISCAESTPGVHKYTGCKGPGGWDLDELGEEIVPTYRCATIPCS